ncbi:hypothetical protein GCM10007421_37320 [Halopseudomonas oceani]|uniref:Uncharacterized protein n=1 Tax=Halopseudomonas oceani TaxID=1708783 RepID=A0A2P4EQC9_9GAMM|nr:hypothetical protein [Halopseudomonas oceani]POB00831.1 hypothetical protein C1949_18605 [Halopseudomonas oceani]GGE59234.1 hypothetical protein GCM10007421_37320 [Halopseudomonas oceani]
MRKSTARLACLLLGLLLCSALNAAPEPAESDFDEPVNAVRLAFIERFTERLRNGEPVADLLTANVTFSYYDNNPCRLITTSKPTRLPAAAVDSGFTVAAHFELQHAACESPETPELMLTFNLHQLLADWTDLYSTAEDHNFDAFSVLKEGRSDYLFLHIAPLADDYAVTRIEYYAPQ